MYRQADRVIKAMSPMFLGGLTARAMQLKSKWLLSGVAFTEVYPGGWVRQHEFASHIYLKRNTGLTEDFIQLLKKEYSEYQFPAAENWHQVDSMICWLIGLKYLQGKATAVGDPDEGQIWI
jgi:predicted nuclease with RNAse H fold